MTSSCQDSDASLNFSFPATLNFSTPIVKDRELEILTITSIQTLKRVNKKCWKDEVFRLFGNSVDDVTKEACEKLLELSIQNQSVRLNIILVNKDFGAMLIVTVSYGFCGAKFKNHIYFCWLVLLFEIYDTLKFRKNRKLSLLKVLS